jgi:hypothetical protein
MKSSAGIAATHVSPFQSFWMGGFECTDQINAFGQRVDFLELTGHLRGIDGDYRAMEPFGIRTVREGIRWSHVEKAPYVYDWTVVRWMIERGREHGVQQVWDICHFGFPDDLTPLHPMFARRFAALCRAFVEFYRSVMPEGELIVTPINEVSFLSWLGGDVRGTSPFCVGQGWEVKYRLMKAYIEGVEALKEADPGVRILTTEPLVRITHRADANREARACARRQHEDQFQVLDILGGRMCPELRGRPEYLDVLGFNFYYNNQWLLDPHEFLDWRPERGDVRWQPLHQLLVEAHRRYARPMVLTETSHPKEDRPRWASMIARECGEAMSRGVPLQGVCWYPLVDRPDWDHPDDWHHAGLWDRDPAPGGEHGRVLHGPTAEAFQQGRELLELRGRVLSHAGLERGLRARFNGSEM